MLPYYIMMDTVYGYGSLILMFVYMTFIKVHRCNSVVLMVGFIGMGRYATVSTYKTSTQKWIEM